MNRATPWLAVMKNTISIAPISSIDRRGNPTPGTAVSYSCRIAGRTKSIVSAEGRAIPYSHTVYLGSGAVIEPDSYVTLTTGFANSTEGTALHPKIVKVNGPFPDESGINATSTLYLQ